MLHVSTASREETEKAIVALTGCGEGHDWKVPDSRPVIYRIPTSAGGTCMVPFSPDGSRAPAVFGSSRACVVNCQAEVIMDTPYG